MQNGGPGWFSDARKNFEQRRFASALWPIRLTTSPRW
jgi:hypothetical protein